MNDADSEPPRIPEPDPDHSHNDACLVQIYPANVINGMVRIEVEDFIIGRQHDCELTLEDPSVADHHAKISRSPEGFRISDLGSESGTFVGDHPADSSVLRSGDTVRVGTFLFKYLSAGSIESQYHATLYSALTRDALTGTMNQRYLLETLERSIAAALRQNSPLSVVMIDIDHFKTINDQFGHLIGDAVLKEFGSRLIQTCRRDDMVARYGGEEFCLLLSATDAKDAVDSAQMCRQAIRESAFSTSQGEIAVTASFGVACLAPDQPESAQTLLRRADEQMYLAKRAGRDRVCGPAATA
ncbi:diguanylate cyclase [Stieleria sp. JC731]|uniref:diguanylate cyclase n=1 Tax=Pirellulaceae TaxID=2691357 RepID=UPI001E5F1C85|nr:GGDEF domain-containing protein [Stieleria sp. JC731]MCC9604081.1 diguanylate cyclase [Stieleria sp. JC731]